MHEEKYGTPKPETELTVATYEKLNKGLEQGFKFGKDAGADPAVLHMQRNLFRFSGAKSLAQALEMNKALYKDGQVRDWDEFKQMAIGINEKYNKNYLQAEWQTARQAGHHAREWQRFHAQKHLFPNLKYRTAGDHRVREEHAAIDDVIAPVDSDFWDKYYPPNGWRCRCYVIQTAEPVSKNIPDSVGGIKPEFELNVGKQWQVFKEKPKRIGNGSTAAHPYFELAEKAGAMKAIDKMADKKVITDIKDWAKKSLIKKKVNKEEVGQIEFSMSGMKEALNQPHKHQFDKNIALYNIEKLIKEALFVKTENDIKGRNFKWHYLETSIAGEVSYIVIREDLNMKTKTFYSIVDKLK